MSGMGFLSEMKCLEKNKLPGYAFKNLKQKLFDYPESITVEASSRCNLNCAFCISADLGIEKKRTRAIFPLEEFERLVDEMSGRCPRMNFSMYGEPLLNPQLCDMIAYSEGKGMLTTLVTNATLLTPENRKSLLDSCLTRIVVSLESFDKEVYQETKRGGDLSQTLENIKGLVEKKRARKSKKPQVVLRQVITQKTVAGLEDFLREARALGADAVSLKPLAVWPQGGQAYKTSLLEEFTVDHPISRFRKNENGRYTLKERSCPCFSLNKPALLSDGRLNLCWYDPLGETAVGNIQKDSFMTIWRKARSFRKKSMRGGDAFPICRECPGIGAQSQRLIYLR